MIEDLDVSTDTGPCLSELKQLSKLIITRCKNFNYFLQNINACDSLQTIIIKGLVSFLRNNLVSHVCLEKGTCNIRHMYVFLCIHTCKYTYMQTDYIKQGPHGSLKSLKVFKNMKSMKSL